MCGENAEAVGCVGKDWWGRRSVSRAGTNKLFKRLTHKIERMRAKRVIEKEFVNLENELSE